jgi:uncharacterized membrane protein
MAGDWIVAYNHVARDEHEHCRQSVSLTAVHRIPRRQGQQPTEKRETTMKTTMALGVAVALAAASPAMAGHGGGGGGGGFHGGGGGFHGGGFGFHGGGFGFYGGFRGQGNRL